MWLKKQTVYVFPLVLQQWSCASHAYLCSRVYTELLHQLISPWNNVWAQWVQEWLPMSISWSTSWCTQIFAEFRVLLYPLTYHLHFYLLYTFQSKSFHLKLLIGSSMISQLWRGSPPCLWKLTCTQSTAAVVSLKQKRLESSLGWQSSQGTVYKSSSHWKHFAASCNLLRPVSSYDDWRLVIFYNSLLQTCF